ncbi:hypothetical protein GGR53DRAFT_464837 [Hypoxylon sp. FL1150]|nr:hypothetical protein GGR53DRAFT_464837 [Hypoxylon sp. FL1150]
MHGKGEIPQDIAQTMDPVLQLLSASQCVGQDQHQHHQHQQQHHQQQHHQQQHHQQQHHQQQHHQQQKAGPDIQQNVQPAPDHNVQQQHLHQSPTANPQPGLIDNPHRKPHDAAPHPHPHPHPNVVAAPTAPQGASTDWQQAGACLQLIAHYRHVLHQHLGVAGRVPFLGDLAGAGEWPRELFRIECPGGPYEIALYGAKIDGNAVIDPRDEALWRDLVDVARHGVGGGVRVIPRQLLSRQQQRRPRVAVRFMRVRYPCYEMTESSEVSDGEYWARPRVILGQEDD